MGEGIGQAVPAHQVKPHPGGGRAVVEGRPQPELGLVGVIRRIMVAPPVAASEAGPAVMNRAAAADRAVLRSNTRTRRVTRRESVGAVEGMACGCDPLRENGQILPWHPLPGCNGRLAQALTGPSPGAWFAAAAQSPIAPSHWTPVCRINGIPTRAARSEAHRHLPLGFGQLGRRQRVRSPAKGHQAQEAPRFVNASDTILPRFLGERPGAGPVWILASAIRRSGLEHSTDRCF